MISYLILKECHIPVMSNIQRFLYMHDYVHVISAEINFIKLFFLNFLAHLH